MLQAELQQRRGIPVQYHEVGLVTGGQAADPLVQAQRTGAAQGGQVQGLERIEAAALQLLDLVGLIESLQQREAGTGADVAAHADL
ncbi:hypothetical protein D3C75_842020 [compost metagenome]